MKYCIALFVFALLATTAHAQTARKWNETDLAWTASTTCSDGSPVTNCAATGYRIERATAATGPWTAVVTLPASATTYRATGLPAGTNHFRWFTLSAGGESVASSVVSSVNTAPLPNPPTPRVVEPTAFEIRPNSTGTLVATRIGIIEAGALCSAETREVGAVTYNRVDTRSVDLVNWPGALKPIEAWAQCS
jgi:hypothetical protein